MAFDKIRPEPIRLPEPRPARAPYAEGTGPAPVRAPEGVSRADRIEISAEGRRLAAQQSTAGAHRPEPLTTERAQAIRQRIDSGAYDAPEVLETVARRMLERGDV
jgi:hypothetical protein